MAATEHQGGGGGSLGFLGLSILSFRRPTPSSATADHFAGAGDDDDDLEGFQSVVTDLLLSLVPSSDDLLLTLAFLSRLLGALLACELRFRSLVLSAAARNPSALVRPPLDRLVTDLLDRALKALDLCNAASLALISLRPWCRHAHIAASALLLQNPNPNPNPNPNTKPRLRRARRALAKLLSDPVLRSPSFGSTGSSGGAHARSLSRSVSKNWVAGRSPDLSGGGGGGGGGLALAVYTMSSVLGLAMWALATAVPCGGTAAAAFAPAAPGPAPALRSLRWGAAMAALQERIAEELRRRERKGGAAGLFAEMQRVERSGRSLMAMVEEGEEEEEEEEEEEASAAASAAASASELDEACRAMEAGLGPLELQVRTVFHRIVGGRAEVLNCLVHSATATATAAAPRASPLTAAAAASAAAAAIPVLLERDG